MPQFYKHRKRLSGQDRGSTGIKTNSGQTEACEIKTHLHSNGCLIRMKEQPAKW